MDLSVFASDWTIIYLIAGLGENWPGLILALAFFAFCRSREISGPKATAYTCYFLAGIVVAHLQVRIAFGMPLGEYGLSVHGAEVVVAFLFVIALVATYKSTHRGSALLVLAGLTVVLGVLQFSASQILILNWVARTYALVCIIVPIAALISIPWHANHSRR